MAYEDLGFTPAQNHSDIGFEPVKKSGQTPTQDYGMNPGVSTRSPNAQGFMSELPEPQLAAFSQPGLNLNEDVSPVHPIKALLTNDPVGFLDSNIRSLPSTMGAVAGGAAGLLSGPLAPYSVPFGAFAGGTGGEGLRQAAVGLNAWAGNTQAPSLKEGAADALKSGVVKGVTAGVGEVAQDMIPFLKKAITGELRIGPNIKTDIGEAVLSKTRILSEALSPTEMTQQYQAFEKANGLISPRAARAVNGNLVFKPGQAEDAVNATYQKLIATSQNSAAPSTQELYEASQAARFLRDQAKFSNPNQAANLGNINEAKTAIDAALESATAKSGYSYQALRQNNFESKAAQQFKSPYPVNLNGQPNVLRSIAAARTGAEFGAGIGAMYAGLPGALAGGAVGGVVGPVFVSPLAAGLAIRGVAAISPAALSSGRILTGGIERYYRRGTDAK